MYSTSNPAKVTGHSKESTHLFVYIFGKMAMNLIRLPYKTSHTSSQLVVPLIKYFFVER
jgi:hypothetical protein